MPYLVHVLLHTNNLHNKLNVTKEKNKINTVNEKSVSWINMKSICNSSSGVRVPAK